MLPRWTGERYPPLMASRYMSAGAADGKDPQPWPLRVQPGDALILYTDGLVEVQNGREEYGMRRLKKRVGELGNRPAREITSGVLADLRAFTGGREQRDDVTLVVVKRTMERDQMVIKKDPDP